MKDTIVIGCDNAALRLKNELIQLIESRGIQVEDVGCYSEEDSIYYPNVAEKVCKRIIESNYTKRGVLVCGTGIGMAITANKFKGIRAAVCHDSFSAERSVLSNNCNVICMGERVIGRELAKKIMKEWLDLEFVDGSSTPKVNSIVEIEERQMK